MTMSPKQEVVRARIEADIKQDAERILQRLGLTHSAFITLSYRAIIEHAGIPFPVSVPNEASRKAITEGRERRKTTTSSISPWRKSLKSV